MNLSCVCADFNGTNEDMGVSTENIVDESNLNDNEILIESENSQNINLDENDKIDTVFSSQNHTFNHPGSVFKAVLEDEYGNPLEGANVSFTINGITYYRICDENGVANMNINLVVPGIYPISYSYSGDNEYSSSSGNAIINIVDYKLSSKIESYNLVKFMELQISLFFF